MMESSIKYGVVVLFACLASVMLPKADVIASYKVTTPDVVQPVSPVLQEVHEANDMEKHWGVRVRS